MKRAFYKILSITLVAMLMCSMLTLTASAATTKRIPVVTVKGIDAPVEGGYGDYTVTLGHPTYELVDVNDNEHINGIRWIDEDGNIMVPGIDRFRAGVKYTVAIHLISKYSYTFEPVSCTLDGEEVSWQGDLRIVQLTKTFEATEDLSDINTITFDYGFDGIKEYTFCNSGETIPYPDYYENGDLVLFDWYNDKEFTNKCDFEAPVYDNKTIYARYVDSADIVSVYMYTTDSDFPQSIEEAVIGDCLNVPDPEEEGMCFRGWYLDKEFTRPFYKNQSITEDISIYAKFVPLSEMHTVSLYYEDDTTPVSTFLIEDGYRYLITSKPSIEGKVFFGWFTDPERLTPYNSLQPITEDTSIYAKFVAEEDLCYVSVYIDGDKLSSTGYVERGTTYSRPDPSMEGKTFFGWYADPERLEEFDFSQPITEDVSIYAKFVADEDICYVDIYLDGDTPIASGMIEKGTTYYIEDPAIEDAVFFGWYCEPERINKFDFSQPITEDVSIYAKFVNYEDICYVNIYLDDDEFPIASGCIEKGTTYSIEPPYREGMIFDGWYCEPERINRFDFSQTITEDVSIYAKFVPEIVFLLGDVNEDGVVNIVDATDIQKYIVGFGTLSETGVMLADVDATKTVDIKDATEIQKYIAGLSSEFRIGQPI